MAEKRGLQGKRQTVCLDCPWNGVLHLPIYKRGHRVQSPNSPTEAPACPSVCAGLEIDFPEQKALISHTRKVRGMAVTSNLPKPNDSLRGLANSICKVRS